MRLTHQETYDLVHDKEKYLAIPVVFCHPANTAPGETALEESIKRYNENWETYRETHVEFWDTYPSTGKVFSDFDGRHTWRNIHTGKELVTITIGDGQWSGWVLRPTWDEWRTYFSSPLFLRDDRLFAEHYVLCDELTPDQVQAWEVFRKTSEAEREAYLHSSKSVQIKLF